MFTVNYNGINMWGGRGGGGDHIYIYKGLSIDICSAALVFGVFQTPMGYPKKLWYSPGPGTAAVNQRIHAFPHATAVVGAFRKHALCFRAEKAQGTRQRL